MYPRVPGTCGRTVWYTFRKTEYPYTKLNGVTSEKTDFGYLQISHHSTPAIIRGDMQRTKEGIKTGMHSRTLFGIRTLSAEWSELPIPTRSRHFSPKYPDRLWGPHSLPFNGYRHFYSVSIAAGKWCFISALHVVAALMSGAIPPVTLMPCLHLTSARPRQ